MNHIIIKGVVSNLIFRLYFCSNISKVKKMSTYNIELVSLDKSFKSSSRLLRRRNAFSVDLDLSANKKATKVS